MGPDFFKFVPSEIILNILSRLPAPTAMSCKCVCKPWLILLKTPEFVKSHLSKSFPGLALFLGGNYKVFEFANDLTPKSSWNMILNFNLPCDEPPYASADGLLFLCIRGMLSHDIFTYEYTMWPRDLFICNPVTREYIKLPCPPRPSSLEPQVEMDTFGFGTSRVTGQYKLVRVFHEWPERVIDSPESARPAEPMCQVYNVGTGSWSRVASAGPFKYEGNAKGAYVDGNIHWIVRDINVDASSFWISCFDLQTELFSTLCLPPLHDAREDCVNLSTLRGCVCLCDNSGDVEIVIWLMKEYGDDKSWTKEFVIHKQNHDYDQVLLCPIKAFQNGNILMAVENYHRLLYFSDETKSICEVDLFGLESGYWIDAVGYTPSFQSLKTLAVEKVNSF